MDKGTAVKILRSLFDGVDPFTGEIYGRRSPYQHPDTLRALAMAIEAMRTRERSAGRSDGVPANAGKPWTGEEEATLVRAHDGGAGLNELAGMHGRSRSAIRARLIRLGKIEP